MIFLIGPARLPSDVHVWPRTGLKKSAHRSFVAFAHGPESARRRDELATVWKLLDDAARTAILRLARVK